jgi:N6-L-threonylcarbamoyladenine synthase
MSWTSPPRFRRRRRQPGRSHRQRDRDVPPRHPTGRDLVVAGGVAANRALRNRLAAPAASRDMNFTAPPAALCTDNAAMIAWAGLSGCAWAD